MDYQQNMPNPKMTPEARAVGILFLLCVAAVIVAFTIKVFRWIVGF
jgi:hypothetical protein